MCRSHSLVVVICSFLLLTHAALMMPRALGKLPFVANAHYRTACGPIACFAALRTLGVECSLDELVTKCDWEEGKLIPLSTLEAVIQSYRGIDGQLSQLSPQELCQLLRDDHTVVILATRGDSERVDHAVCAVDATDNDQGITLIDYPEMVQEQTMTELADAWDGAALVVRISPTYRAIEKFAVLFPPLVVCAVAAFGLRRWRRRATSIATHSSEPRDAN
jgi:hypothetical protein